MNTVTVTSAIIMILSAQGSAWSVVLMISE